MDDFIRDPVSSTLLLWVCYMLLAGLGTVLAIFIIGYPALALKWVIDWIKRGQEAARERRQSVPE